jgi:hypothetical protein
MMSAWMCYNQLLDDLLQAWREDVPILRYRCSSFALVRDAFSP